MAIKMVQEQCESQIANLLAGLSNLPDGDTRAKINVLIAVIEAQQKEIEKLRAEAVKLYVGGIDREGKREATELHMDFMGENFVWFKARTKDGLEVETMPLRGEV